jgi:hypothetical protein
VMLIASSPSTFLHLCQLSHQQSSSINCQPSAQSPHSDTCTPGTKMDPFTISTGVAGFLSLALEISKIIATYINDVKSAPDEAHNLLEEVKSLCHVLNQLVEFFEKDAKDRRNFQPTSALCLVISACRQQIEDLHKKLKRFQVSIDGGAGRVSGFVERLKWPLKKEDYQNTIATLHRFVQTFQFSLQISNWFVIPCP